MTPLRPEDLAKIRPEDLVRLRHSPEWTAEVIALPDPDLDDGVLVDHRVPGGAVVVWVPVEWLELVPNQMERFVA